MSAPSKSDLINAIADATRAAVSELFEKQPGAYYYLTLVSTGDAAPCVLSAWSREALDESGDPDLKWSYADSPFHAYGWEKYFGHVRDLFAKRPDMDCNDEQAWAVEYEFRYECMEAAISRLDSEGLFGTGMKRNELMVNVEVMPPDHTNVERAHRLNPPQALAAWLEEAAEANDQETT